MPNLYHRDGDIWHYTFTVEGRRIRASARTADKAIARDVAIKHENRERRAAVHGPETVITFTQAVGLYLDAGKDSRFVLAALDYFKDTLLSRVTPPMVRQAAIELYPNGAPATRNRQGISPIQAIINFAADKGLCPPLRVRRFPVQRVERAAGDKIWLAAFQRAARGKGRPGMAAYARFMFETGARLSQALVLQWGDVDLTAGTAKLVTRKTGPGGGTWMRSAHLTPAMVAEMANLERKGPRVFGFNTRSNVTKVWNDIVAGAKIAGLDRHEAGRHGFATEMIVRNGIDIPTAADAGGWKSRRLMLDTYAHGEGVKETINAVFGTQRTQRKGKGR